MLRRKRSKLVVPTDVATELARASDAAGLNDFEAALDIWNVLAHRSNARAQAEIGRCFTNGVGVERNVALARTWLELSARNGDPLGQRLFADFCFNGEDGTTDRAIAEEWYDRAARQGEPRAQDMLSWILTEGDHRAPDYDAARRWALAAAEQGVPQSMTRLGLLYHNALGVDRDATLAAFWWSKAALLGDADGRAMLGVAHHLGAGVAKDPVRALAWLTLARGGGSPFAALYYDAVRLACSTEQQTAAAVLTYRDPSTWAGNP